MYLLIQKIFSSQKQHTFECGNEARMTFTPQNCLSNTMIAPYSAAPMATKSIVVAEWRWWYHPPPSIRPPDCRVWSPLPPIYQKQSFHLMAIFSTMTVHINHLPRGITMVNPYPTSVWRSLGRLWSYWQWVGVGGGLGGGGRMSTDAIVTDATCNNQLHITGRVEYSRMTNKRGQSTTADG